MNNTFSSLPLATDKGKLNVMHLKRYWGKVLAKRDRQLPHNALSEEWMTDITLLSTLGIGLEQTLKYLGQQTPAFDEFEDWILAVNNGRLSNERILKFNAQIEGKSENADGHIIKILTDGDMAFWNENGYIILRNAVPKEDCVRTVALICEYLGIKEHEPATWYNAHPDRQGIMVQLFQHPQLQKNRESQIIGQAYEQLWNRKDILVNTDRVGFNPPETDDYKFPGPRLHWDVSLALPIPFGLQGILYLTDTLANQGALTLVPGFQNNIAEWICSLPAGANPRNRDLYALGAIPIAANAGDFIIWHQALPHGSSPNRATVPRFVQYINYQPIDPEIKEEWI